MSFPILFKYPSRGRPERFFKSLDSIYNNLNDRENFYISCTFDTDDLTMNNAEVINRINEYKNISITWGLSDSKIHAINRDMPDYNFKVLINMSDDMLFNTYGFDDMIRIDMNAHFPQFDGLLHYPDQDAKEYLATMYIAGVNFYNRFGYIYHPSYKSLWCDNEVMDVAKKIGKYKYCGYQINLHLNPAYLHNNMERDEMFNRQQDDWNEDERNYYERKAKNFEL